MSNIAPQSVTSRYVNNLLRHGSNADFYVLGIQRNPSDPVGHHYLARVSDNLTVVKNGVGVNPENAIMDALTQFGVTFR